MRVASPICGGLLALAACTPTGPVGASAGTSPVSASRAVALFDEVCVETRPMFSDAQARLAAAIGPDEGASVTTSTETGRSVCTMRFVSGAAGNSGLSALLGPLRQVEGSPSLFAYEGRGRGRIFYTPGPQNTARAGTYELGVLSQ